MNRLKKYFAELKEHDNILYKISWIYICIIALLNFAFQGLARYISFLIYNIKTTNIENLYSIEKLKLNIEYTINAVHIILIIYYLFSMRKLINENKIYIPDLFYRNKALLVFFIISMVVQIIIAIIFSIGSRLNLNSFIMHLIFPAKIIVLLLIIQLIETRYA
ncbi:hypothetical protein [Paratissierella segnis]|jgi:magnesium-transporting ATPase (P-type)|nr:hypothetical protein [Paratissierella segnis]